MPLEGLSAMKGSSNSNSQQSSGMSGGPQGYHVLTPLELAPGTSDRNLVWVNRGWVPKKFVAGADQPYRRQGPVEAAKIQEAMKQSPAWSRPKGVVNITTVQSQVESEYNRSSQAHPF
jgi:cytochrome oxidase assembly protein ShyY1